MEVIVQELPLPKSTVLLPTGAARVIIKDSQALSNISEQLLSRNRRYPIQLLKALSLWEGVTLAVVFPERSQENEDIGTLVRVVQVDQRKKNETGIVIYGLLRVVRLTEPDSNMYTKVEIPQCAFSGMNEELGDDEVRFLPLIRELREVSETFIKNLSKYKTSSKAPLSFSSAIGLKGMYDSEAGTASPVHSSSALVDLVASVIPIDFRDKCAILREFDVDKRYILAINAITKRTHEISRISRSKPITSKSTSDAIIPTKSEDEDNDDGVGGLVSNLLKSNIHPEGLRIIKREAKRLKRMNTAQAEYQICRTYLETLSEIPWNNVDVSTLDAGVLERSQEILDKDHYGLDKVKRRLVEYLAVQVLSQHQKDPSIKTPILLLVGPPGVGKTSLAKSVAKVLGRKLYRVSLGGVRDESEIRGHRRTYVGAMPGVFIDGLRKAKTMNPVMVLDEIDKLNQVTSIHGDPSAAMLEVLDPEQNNTFGDRYVGFPVDLSRVLFIATANTIDTISPPLLDRMEVIEVGGYTYIEKRHIAERHLIPKQLAANGLTSHGIEFDPRAVEYIISNYTREPGARNLERKLGTICRGKAVEILSDPNTDKVVLVKDVHKYLGSDKYVDEKTEKDSGYGVVNGLAYISSGNGGILKLEATGSANGKGRLELTGSLGEVISESAHVAFSWVKANLNKLGLPSTALKDIDVHLHAPAGSIPKDGPSAGAAMVVTFVSLLLKRPVPADIALTGEITLRGVILPVGGIREKLLGANLAGVKQVILPERCANQVDDEGDLFKDLGIQIFYARTMWDVFGFIWGDSLFTQSKL